MTDKDESLKQKDDPNKQSGDPATTTNAKVNEGADTKFSGDPDKPFQGPSGPSKLDPAEKGDMTNEGINNPPEKKGKGFTPRKAPSTIPATGQKVGNPAKELKKGARNLDDTADPKADETKFATDPAPAEATTFQENRDQRKKDFRKEVREGAVDDINAPKAPIAHTRYDSVQNVPAEVSEIQPAQGAKTQGDGVKLKTTEDPAPMPHEVIMEAYHGTLEDFYKFQDARAHKIVPHLDFQGAPEGAKWLVLVDAGGSYRAQRADDDAAALEIAKGLHLREGVVVHKLSR